MLRKTQVGVFPQNTVYRTKCYAKYRFEMIQIKLVYAKYKFFEKLLRN
jgi:hypothetical protein